MMAAMRLRMAPKRAIFHSARRRSSSAASPSTWRRSCCEASRERMARRLART